MGKTKDGLKAHHLRVGELSYKLAQYINTSQEEAKNISLAGSCHDIGKIFIPEKILNKPGKLTVREFEQIKFHAIYSYIILKGKGYKSNVCSMVRHHHENFDGTGYPDQLKGQDISLGARILRITDMFDSLISDRVYRKGVSVEKALLIMEEEKKYFDPILFKSFRKMIWIRE